MSMIMMLLSFLDVAPMEPMVELPAEVPDSGLGAVGFALIALGVIALIALIAVIIIRVTRKPSVD